MRIPAAGADEKFVVFGALDYASGQLFTQSSPRRGEEAFAAFLDALAAMLPPDEPIVIVLDTVGYHKSHALRAHWQRLADHVEPFWLARLKAVHKGYPCGVRRSAGNERLVVPPRAPSV